MYELHYTSRFLKDVKRCKQEGRDLRELEDAFDYFREDGMLPEAYKPHILHDEWQGYWEAHLDDDWLIAWRKDGEQIILLAATGTHVDLFGKP